MPATSELLAAYVGTRPVTGMFAGLTPVTFSGGVAAPEFVGSNFSPEDVSGLATVQIPAEAVAGDFAVLFVSEYSTSGTTAYVVNSPGWALAEYLDGANVISSAILSKVLTEDDIALGEIESLTDTVGGQASYISVFRGVNRVSVTESLSASGNDKVQTVDETMLISMALAVQGTRESETYCFQQSASGFTQLPNRPGESSTDWGSMGVSYYFQEDGEKTSVTHTATAAVTWSNFWSIGLYYDAAGPAVAAPTLIGSTASASTSTSQAVSLPANSAGDLLLIGTNNRNSTALALAPAGWRRVFMLSSSLYSLRTVVYAKISDGSEPDPVLTSLSTGGGMHFAQVWKNAGLPDEDGQIGEFARSNSTAVETTEVFEYTYQYYQINPAWSNPAGESDVVMFVGSGSNDYTYATFGGSADGRYSIETTNSNDSSMFFTWAVGSDTPTYTITSNGFGNNNEAGLFIIPALAE